MGRAHRPAALLFALLSLPLAALAAEPAPPATEPSRDAVGQRSLGERARLWQAVGTPADAPAKPPLRLEGPRLGTPAGSARRTAGGVMLTVAGLTAGLTVWSWGFPESYFDAASAGSGAGLVLGVPILLFAAPATVLFATFGAKLVAAGYALDAGLSLSDTHLYGVGALVSAGFLTFGYLATVGSGLAMPARLLVIGTTVATWIAFTTTALSRAPGEGRGYAAAGDATETLVVPFVAPDRRGTAFGLAWAGTL